RSDGWRTGAANSGWDRSSTREHAHRIEPAGGTHHRLRLHHGSHPDDGSRADTNESKLEKAICDAIAEEAGIAADAATRAEIEQIECAYLVGPHMHARPDLRPHQP